MLGAAGRALVARAAAGASSATPASWIASSSGSAAAPLVCWQRGLASWSAASLASTSASAAAASEQPPLPSEPAGGSSDQQEQQQQEQQGQQQAAAAPSTSPAASPSPAAPASATQVGPRLVQPLSRTLGGGGGGGGSNDRAGGGGGGGGPPGRSLTGTVHVASTPNNTLLTLLSREGLVRTLVTGGSVGFRNSAKGTPQAAEKAAAELARRALAMGIGSVGVRFRGTGRNKQYAVSALAAGGLNVTSLEDVTPVAYNGCRLPRRWRV
jgi:small subunit ribosomal protein S11